MNAIEYGKKYFKDFSLNNQINNIKVFCESIKVNDQNSSNEITDNTEYLYLECDYIEDSFPLAPYYQKNINGLHLPTYVIDYIRESKATTIIEKTGQLFWKPETQNQFATVTVCEIEGKNYVYYNRTASGVSQLPEIPIKSIKLNKPLFYISEMLKEKQLSVIVFTSTDGALLESAYQKIDTVYKNELILFIEKNDKSNYFGSVIRLKTGENVNSNSNLPTKQIAEITSGFNLNIEKESIEEVLNNHFNVVGEFVYAIRKWFIFGDRVVVFAAKIVLEPFKMLSEGLSEFLESLKLSDSNWKFYDDDGNALKNPDLLLPGLALFESLKLQSKNAEINHSGYKTIIQNALEILEQLKAKINQSNFKVNKVTKKIGQKIIDVIDLFLEFLLNPMDSQIELGKQSFILVNAFIVGTINGLIEAVKGLVELIGLGIRLIEESLSFAITTEEFTGSVAMMFIEMLENALEFCTNLFSKENMKAILQFFKDTFVFIVTLPSKVYNWITADGNNSVTLDQVGYYLGYIIGTIIEIILETIATGGAATVGEAIQKFSQEIINATKSIGTAVKKGAKATVKGLQISFEFLLSIFKYIREKSKNLKTFFEDFWKIIESLFATMKSKIILSSGMVLQCEIIPIGTFANGLKNILKTRWLRELEGLGLVIAKQSDDAYSFVYKGVEIFKGTKAEAETALKEYFENSKKGGLEKYLDEIKLIKNIPGIKNFSKWFDEISILDFEKLWAINKAKSKISGLIRHPGGLHEWLMCSRANVFKKWGVEMSEIKELRTRIEDVIFKNPPGYHGGPGSTKAHNEILELIDDSKNYEEFKSRLINWSENRLKNGKNDLPNGFFK